MKNKKIMIVVLSLACIGFIFYHSIQATYEVDYNETEIVEDCKELFQQRASLLIDGTLNDLYAGFIDQSQNDIENDFRQEICNYKEIMKTNGEMCNKVEVIPEVIKIEKNEDTVVIDIKEVTYVYINEVKTGYTANHQIHFQYIDDQWKMIKDLQLEPSGLIPLVEANKYCVNQ